MWSRTRGVSCEVPHCNPLIQHMLILQTVPELESLIFDQEFIVGLRNRLTQSLEKLANQANLLVGC